MRVLYTSQAYTTHDRRFLQAIADGGFDVHFVSLVPDEPDYTRQPLPKGVIRHRWLGRAVRNSADARAATLSFRNLVHEVRPNVVHAGPLPSVALTAILASAAPVLAMSWGSDVLMDGISDPRIATEIAFVLERATAVAVDCRAVLDVCEGWSPGCLKKTFLFPWGIDLTAYSPTTANSSRLRLLCTRTWAPIYGIETLVKSFSQAAKLEHRLDLVLAADGPLSQVILGLIKDLHLEGRIQLPGRLPESSLPALFSAVDGYISASLSDGTSISLLEAMASALPVIVSDIPANHEWVTRGESGWIVKPGDVDGYTDAILSFARTHPSSRRAMGERNREVMLARGDWSMNRKELWRALRFAGSGEGG